MDEYESAALQADMERVSETVIDDVTSAKFEWAMKFRPCSSPFHLSRKDIEENIMHWFASTCLSCDNCISALDNIPTGTSCDSGGATMMRPSDHAAIRSLLVSSRALMTSPSDMLAIVDVRHDLYSLFDVLNNDERFIMILERTLVHHEVQNQLSNVINYYNASGRNQPAVFHRLSRDIMILLTSFQQIWDITWTSASVRTVLARGMVYCVTSLEVIDNDLMHVKAMLDENDPWRWGKRLTVFTRWNPPERIDMTLSAQDLKEVIGSREIRYRRLCPAENKDFLVQMTCSVENMDGMVHEAAFRFRDEGYAIIFLEVLRAWGFCCKEMASLVGHLSGWRSA
jgi:hypothetical protein